MNLILGIVVLIAWVVYRTTRPSQFRVIELGGEYYLEIKGWLTGIWWDAYAWASGDITYDSDVASPYNSLEKVPVDAIRRWGLRCTPLAYRTKANQMHNYTNLAHSPTFV